MMWNNAGSFLAPKQAIVHTPVVPCNSGDSSDPPCSSSGGDNLDFNMDFTVTTAVPTPSALDIARRDPFWGVEQTSLEVQPSFFAKGNIPAPRLIHKVNINIPMYIYFTHNLFLHISYNCFGSLTWREYSRFRIRTCGDSFAQFGHKLGCAKVQCCAQLAHW